MEYVRSARSSQQRKFETEKLLFAQVKYSFIWTWKFRNGCEDKLNNLYCLVLRSLKLITIRKNSSHVTHSSASWWVIACFGLNNFEQL